MRKFILSSSLALLLVGSVAVASADARPWRRGGWGGGGYYSAYPSYYSYSVPEYVVPQTTYVTPGYTSYYAPETYIAPTYSSTYRGYYSPSLYYNPGYRWGGNYGGYGRRGWYGWRR